MVFRIGIGGVRQDHPRDDDARQGAVQADSSSPAACYRA